MSLDQRLIQKQIEKNNLIVQCCVTGLVRSPRGYFVGFRFKEDYANISHTYCNEIYQELLYQIKNE